MISRILRGIAVAHVVIGLLIAVIVISPPSSRIYGDRLQVALPMLAWGCSVLNNSGRELVVRFAATMGVVHASKAALGDAPINQRPSGRLAGFPSGHTTAAAFGASSLVHACLKGHPAAKTVVVVAAAFVGGSRIDAGAHNIWQVLAGWLLGWAGERVLRHDGPARSFALRQIHAFRAGVGGMFRRAYMGTVAWFVDQRAARGVKIARPAQASGHADVAPCPLPQVMNHPVGPGL